MARMRIRPVALATATSLVGIFILDWFLALALPTWGLERLWEALLPAYRAGRPEAFWWGLVASAATGVYVGAVFVPLYNRFHTRVAPGGRDLRWLIIASTRKARRCGRWESALFWWERSC